LNGVENLYMTNCLNLITFLILGVGMGIICVENLYMANCSNLLIFLILRGGDGNNTVEIFYTIEDKVLLPLRYIMFKSYIYLTKNQYVTTNVLVSIRLWHNNCVMKL